jgi:hypothetical protein
MVTDGAGRRGRPRSAAAGARASMRLRWCSRGIRCGLAAPKLMVALIAMAAFSHPRLLLQPTLAAADDFAEQVREYYKRHEPSKLDRVPTILVRCALSACCKEDVPCWPTPPAMHARQAECDMYV